MPRKAFLADLQKVSGSTEFPGISKVCRGDDDGDFKFFVTSDAWSEGFEIECKLSDVSDYPSDHICYFIAPDNAPEWLAKAMESLFDKSSGASIENLLQLASKAITRFTDTDGDVLMEDSQSFGEITDSEDEGNDHEDLEGEDIFFPEERPASSRLGNSAVGAHQSKTDAKFRERIRTDFRHAKAAGFKVAFSDPNILQGAPCYVSLACRIKKLGISEEAMEAWRLSPSEYLILMLRYPLGYKPVDELLGMEASSARQALEIRSGVSHTYRPTLSEFVYAFTDLAKDTKEEFNTLREVRKVDSSVGLRPSFITKPLDGLMNERLLRIINFRDAGLTWVGAAEFYNDFVNSGSVHIDAIPSQYMEPEKTNKVFPEIVTADHITECGGPMWSMSFPVIAMQFFLRHFVRCTEYCLVCFQPLPDMFEAIKPYVCDKPLCLYQYMNLGFGPSVEHEILTQPYVVDLLISFCYVSAGSTSLHSFPSGLGLMLPHIGALENSFQDDVKAGDRPYYADLSKANQILTPPPMPNSCRYNGMTSEMLFEGLTQSPVKMGEWLLIGSSEGTIKYHCRVKSTALFPTVRVSELFHVGLEEQFPAFSKHENKFEDCFFHVYNTNFDDLPDIDKHKAISAILRVLPSVIEMKSYLTSNPSASLSSWTDRLSPTLLGLLRWIVASCRACILEMDDSDEQNSARKSDRVHGMPGYKQFKFAMGAPDKERRFVEAVKEVSARKNLAHPTMFAWHGSPLKNWHGIIREGLHFNKTLHGRAYGDGVYFSLDASTSLGYSGNYYGGKTSFWPNSTLMINNAIALNEVVNAPDEFVSRSPHLVVKQLDWIQTRFLFVKVTTSYNSNGMQETVYNHNNTDVSLPAHPYKQDPSMTPRGEKGTNISIPYNALSRSGGLRDKEDARQIEKPPVAQETKKPNAAATQKTKEKSKKRRLFGFGTAANPIDLSESVSSTAPEKDDDTSSVCTLEEDLVIFKDEVAVQEPEPEKKLTKKATASKPLTDFVPGTLDHSSLAMLTEPAWATVPATKRLQSDFRALLKVQNKEPLHELGWYIDSEYISNMYQWIVELHSFENHLPLAKDLKSKGLTSVVLEFRFGKEYPMSPPFVRVVRPRFTPFQQGGGGHVTIGGALCMELLTNSGWSAVSSIESVLLQVRMAMTSTDPHPARLEHGPPRDYSVGEAVDAYIRACNAHGWTVPPDFREMAYGGADKQNHWVGY